MPGHHVVVKGLVDHGFYDGDLHVDGADAAPFSSRVV
jgi:hypothetical protein